MTDALDLTGEIAAALDTAVLRGDTPVLGYVDADGHAALSFRGSTHVHNSQQIAVWARNPDAGLAKEIAARPTVSLLYFSATGPGPRYLSIRGRAHVDPAANDEVYAKMAEIERERDAGRKGVAVIIDVDTVIGFGTDGQFKQERAA